LITIIGDYVECVNSKTLKNPDHQYNLTVRSDKNAPGIRIAQRRKEKGLTQKELANITNIPWPLVSEYERGRLRLNDMALYKISKALEISTDEILGLETNKHLKYATSLRIMKRVNRIKELPIPKQKALLQVIDGFIKGEKL